jgi:hypothetical protein
MPNSIQASLETTSIRCEKCEVTFVFIKGKENNPCPHLVDWWNPKIVVEGNPGDLVGKWRTDKGILVGIIKWNEQTGYYLGHNIGTGEPLTFDYQGFCLNFPEQVGKIVTKQRGEENI